MSRAFGPSVLVKTAIQAWAARDLTAKLDALLKGRAIEKMLRADAAEIVIELTGGARLFVRDKDGLDMSVT